MKKQNVRSLLALLLALCLTLAALPLGAAPAAAAESDEWVLVGTPEQLSQLVSIDKPRSIKIKLTADMYVKGRAGSNDTETMIRVDMRSNVTIDLNGHTLRTSADNFDEYNHVAVFEVYGALTLHNGVVRLKCNDKDAKFLYRSSPGPIRIRAGGKVDLHDVEVAGVGDDSYSASGAGHRLLSARGITVENLGVLNVYGDKSIIRGEYARTVDAAGVYVEKGGRVNVYGGTIYCKKSSSRGILCNNARDVAIYGADEIQGLAYAYESKMSDESIKVGDLRGDGIIWHKGKALGSEDMIKPGDSLLVTPRLPTQITASATSFLPGKFYDFKVDNSVYENMSDIPTFEWYINGTGRPGVWTRLDKTRHNAYDYELPGSDHMGTILAVKAVPFYKGIQLPAITTEFPRDVAMIHNVSNQNGGGSSCIVSGDMSLVLQCNFTQGTTIDPADSRLRYQWYYLNSSDQWAEIPNSNSNKLPITNAQWHNTALCTEVFTQGGNGKWVSSGKSVPHTVTVTPAQPLMEWLTPPSSITRVDVAEPVSIAVKATDRQAGVNDDNINYRYQISFVDTDGQRKTYTRGYIGPHTLMFPTELMNMFQKDSVTGSNIYPLGEYQITVTAIGGNGQRLVSEPMTITLQSENPDFLMVDSEGNTILDSRSPSSGPYYLSRENETVELTLREIPAVFALDGRYGGYTYTIAEYGPALTLEPELTADGSISGTLVGRGPGVQNITIQNRSKKKVVTKTFSAPVSEVAVEVSHPRFGQEVADMTFETDASRYCDVTMQWFVLGRTDPLSDKYVFQSNVDYEVRINCKVKEGYSFPRTSYGSQTWDVEPAHMTVLLDGEEYNHESVVEDKKVFSFSGNQHDGYELTVRKQFKNQPVTSVAITHAFPDIKEMIGQAKPYINPDRIAITSVPAGIVSVSSVEWSHPEEPFAYFTSEWATINLQVEPGYTLGAGNGIVSLNGTDIYVSANADGTSQILVSFEPVIDTDKTPIKKAVLAQADEVIPIGVPTKLGYIITDPSGTAEKAKADRDDSIIWSLMPAHKEFATITEEGELTIFNAEPGSTIFVFGTSRLERGMLSNTLMGSVVVGAKPDYVRMLSVINGTIGSYGVNQTTGYFAPRTNTADIRYTGDLLFFNRWAAAGVTLTEEQRTSPTISFLMPDSNVVLEAIQLPSYRVAGDIGLGDCQDRYINVDIMRGDEPIMSIRANGTETDTGGILYGVQFNVPPGTYTVKLFKRNGTLARTLTVQVTNANVDLTAIAATLPGDVNGDGVVNIQDVIRLLNHVNNSDKMTDGSIGDIDGNGVVNIQDVIRLLNHVNNSDKLF